MGASGKGKRKKSSFHDIDIKIQRTEIHLEALDREFAGMVDDGLYAFVPEIQDQGRTHIYKAVNPPKVGQYWGAQIGEVVHSLRSALDHLAWQLVIANGKIPGQRTQFPICTAPPRKPIFKCFRHPTKSVPLRISGQVPPRALALIEAVQPYHGTNDGKFIDAINQLDIADKHRELIVTTAVVRQATTSYTEDGRVVTMKFPGRPIKDGEIVAIVHYDPPQLEKDPNLVFTPFITFAKGVPFEGENVIGFAWIMLNFVTNGLMPRFDEWVPMKYAPEP